MNTFTTLLILSTVLSCVYGQTVYTLNRNAVASMQWNTNTFQQFNLPEQLFEVHQISGANNGAVYSLISNYSNYFSLVAIDSNSGNIKQVEGMYSTSEFPTAQFTNVFYDSNLNSAALLFEGNDESSDSQSVDGPTDLALLVYRFQENQIQSTWLGPLNGIVMGSYDQSNQLYYIANVYQTGSYKVSVYNTTTGSSVRSTTIYAPKISPNSLYYVLAANGNLFSFVNIGIKVEIYYLNIENSSQELVGIISTGFWQAIDAFSAFFDPATSSVYFSVYSDSQSSIFQLSFSAMSINTVYAQTAVQLKGDLVYVQQ
ncbi:hypothetical protein CYY_001710 [Polysphondylium violaceum]|uniref:Uncharacterized protein n=1 Tax=Polysphondylium violaceum TaxID=133409 RepID=A0A8J4PZQ5_9MYCE|nr:hypothetical protein CYY_001710 [Polysphondylium violaceum]